MKRIATAPPTLRTIAALVLLALLAASASYATQHGKHSSGTRPDECLPCCCLGAEDSSGCGSMKKRGPTHGDAAELDQRIPVPMHAMMAVHQKEQMRDHLVVIQEIIAATARENWADVETAAGRIGYSGDMAMMCQHMGAARPGFSDVALRFHKTADTISEAARKKDSAAVLAATAATVSVCTGCHATYKQQVVEHDEWRRLTQSSATEAEPNAEDGQSPSSANPSDPSDVPVSRSKNRIP